jgi:serine/threonine protein kinase
MMNGTRTCDRCGAGLTAYAPEGLCARCMMRGALAAGDDEEVPVADIPSPPLSGPAAGEEKPEAGRFGDYELLEELGRGGMGVVYKACQRSLNRIVAIKMVQSQRLASEAMVQRFQLEAEAAASLRHPNIVAIHEVGAHAGQHYFSMDFIEGRSLAETISDSRFAISDFRRSAQWVKIIAEAVHYAHQHGILHRDLKPSNILLDAKDEPHVTDFGLARRLEGESTLTLSGEVPGSPAYMAPEQAGGAARRITIAADLYSLGAILYELLTGRPPFGGATAKARRWRDPPDATGPLLHRRAPRVARFAGTLAAAAIRDRGWFNAHAEHAVGRNHRAGLLSIEGGVKQRVTFKPTRTTRNRNPDDHEITKPPTHAFVPYAIYAGTAGGVSNGAITTAMLADDAVTAAVSRCACHRRCRGYLNPVISSILRPSRLPLRERG